MAEKTAKGARLPTDRAKSKSTTTRRWRTPLTPEGFIKFDEREGWDRNWVPEHDPIQWATNGALTSAEMLAHLTAREPGDEDLVDAMYDLFYHCCFRIAVSDLRLSRMRMSRNQSQLSVKFKNRIAELARPELGQVKYLAHLIWLFETLVGCIEKKIRIELDWAP